MGELTVATAEWSSCTGREKTPKNFQASSSPPRSPKAKPPAWFPSSSGRHSASLVAEKRRRHLSPCLDQPPGIRRRVSLPFGPDRPGSGELGWVSANFPAGPTSSLHLWLRARGARSRASACCSYRGCWKTRTAAGERLEDRPGEGAASSNLQYIYTYIFLRTVF